MGEATRRVTVNLPAKLLERAQAATGLGITETIVRGLEELKGNGERAALRRLRGRVRFELDLRATRK
jgi:hypothetical protein